MTRASHDERQRIAARLNEIADVHDQKKAYMLSYDADWLRELADRIAAPTPSDTETGETQ